MNLLLLAAALSVTGATLTMPGIAGIVLTLGMAIDGNVLIIERIREELRAGNTPINSIVAGYERAWTVILDSNVTKRIAVFLPHWGKRPRMSHDRSPATIRDSRYCWGASKPLRLATSASVRLTIAVPSSLNCI
jgi:hypothetical protein